LDRKTQVFLYFTWS